MFCPLTGQLLIPVVSNGELIFVSAVTKMTYQADPEDSLRFTEDLRKTNMSVANKQLQNLTEDNVNPRKIGECPQCKKIGIIVTIQNGAELETINGCLNCKYTFPEV